MGVLRTVRRGSWEFFLREQSGTLYVDVPDYGGMADSVPRDAAQLAWAEATFAAELPALERVWPTSWEIPNGMLPALLGLIERLADGPSLLSLDRIAEAARVIDPVFLHSPQFENDALSDHLGARVLCKVELLNPIRSFKGRGTDYFLHVLEQAGATDEHLVCASAGNFGQGLAYAARRRGTRVTIFAARTANPLKIERMRSLGGEVRLEGDDFDAAKAAAVAYAEHAGARFVEDGAEPSIAEGAGSLGVELLEWPERIDAVYVPVGNGALASGVGRWIKAHAPWTQVIGVCAAGAPSMYESWWKRDVVQTERADTIADGIAVRVPVARALQDLREAVDRLMLVDDGRIVQAMRLAFEALGAVVEPAGVAGLAGCLEERERLAGRRVAVPLCGGNLTREQVGRWLTPGG
jgi:threonine dehydratase